MKRRDALRLGIFGGGAMLSGGLLTPALAQDAPDVKEMTLGAEDAPVTMIEYASFTCPHCASFHNSTFGKLKEDYIDTGKVRLIYREVYFDRPGLWAGMVARCAGEARYFGVVSLLYEKQREWIGDGTPAQIAQNLRQIGKTAGLSDAELDACLSDADKARAMLDTYEAHMKEYDVQGTPSFVINGELHSNMAYEEMKKLIEAELAAG